MFFSFEIAYRYSVYVNNSKTHIKFPINFCEKSALLLRVVENRFKDSFVYNG